MNFNHIRPAKTIRSRNASVVNQIAGLSRWHFVGIAICAILLMGDFVTTSIALSIGSVSTVDGELQLSEGNPLMQAIVTNPLAFAALKVAILGMVVGAAYVLRDNGFMAYCPYLIVGSMYALVVANNLNILLLTL